jgi:hypothetical protein
MSEIVVHIDQTELRVGIPGGVPGISGNTVLYGVGAPSDSLGTVGNFYISTDTHYLYGPKTTVWPVGVAMIGPSGITTQVFEVAISDEISPLTAGNAKIKFPWPIGFTLTNIYAYVGTAPTISGIIIGVKKNGVTILSTNITIDVNTQFSYLAGVPPVISVPSLTQHAEMQIDLIQVGSGVAGLGGKLYFIGTLT